MILYCGDEAIGKLKTTKTYENWLSGKFSAFGNFKQFKNLFRRLETAWICEAEDYFDYQNEVDALCLTVENDDRVFKIADFKIIGGSFECKIRK